jgi:hypothetical protein
MQQETAASGRPPAAVPIEPGTRRARPGRAGSRGAGRGGAGFGGGVLAAVVGLGDAVSSTEGGNKSSNEDKRQVYT